MKDHAFLVYNPAASLSKVTTANANSPQPPILCTTMSLLILPGIKIDAERNPEIPAETLNVPSSAKRAPPHEMPGTTGVAFCSYHRGILGLNVHHQRCLQSGLDEQEDYSD